MNRIILILTAALIAAFCGCTTMKAVEDDMTNLLKHMEIERLSEKSATDEKGRDAASSPASASVLPKTDRQLKKETYSLTVQVFPRESTVKVMNIKSRYYPGMRLTPGKYDILVENEGFKSYREWIDINYDMILKVVLKEKAEAYMTKSFDSIARADIPPSAPDAGEAVSADSGEVNGLPEKTAESVDDAAAGEEGAVAQGLPSRLSGHYGSVAALCFSPDGQLLASGSYDGMILVWKIEDGSVMHHLNHEDRVAAVAFSPDGGTLLSGGSDRTIKLWDMNTGEQGLTLTGHTGRIHSAAFDPTGKTIVSGANNELIIWDAESGKIKNLIVGDDRLYPVFGPIKAVAFNPAGPDADGYEFAFSCYQGIALFNPASKQLLKLDDISTPHSLAYSSDGTYILWGARHHHYKNDFFPRFVHTDTKKRDLLLSRDDEQAKADRVFYTAWMPDGNHLVMLTYDQAVLYDITAGAVVRKFAGTSETAVTAAALSPDGSILVASAKDLIRVWKMD